MKLTVSSHIYYICTILFSYIFVIEEENEINCLEFLHDGSKFVTSGKDTCVRIYDAETDQV